MSEKKSRSSDTRPKCGLRSWSADSYVWSGKKRSRSSRNEPTSVQRGPEGGEGGGGGPEDPGGGGGGGPLRFLSEETTREEVQLPRPGVGGGGGRGGGGGGGGDAMMDVPCRKAMSRRSLRQKFQDAVGQCLPLRTHTHHHHHHHHHLHHPAPGGGSSSSSAQRPFSVLLWSKRKIHVSELMQDKCPFSPKSELAHCWHLIKKHATHPSAANGLEASYRTPILLPSSSSTSSSPPPTPLSWDNISSGSPGGGRVGGERSGGSASLEDWDPSCPHGGAGGRGGGQEEGCCGHTDYILVPDLLQINNSPCYWGVLDRFEAEELLEGQPEGTFLLRDSAQDEFLFSVSFRRYSRSLHARIEQNGKRFSFDGRDPCMYRDPSVTGLLRHYSDPATCLFFEPLLSRPLPRTFPFSLQHLCRALVCSCTDYQGIDGLPLPYQLRDYLREYHYKCNGDCAL